MRKKVVSLITSAVMVTSVFAGMPMNVAAADDDKVINLLVDDNNIADSDIVSGIFEFSYLGNNNFSDIKFVDSRSTVKDLKK